MNLFAWLLSFFGVGKPTAAPASPAVIEHKHVIIRAEVNKPPTRFDTGFMGLWFQDLVSDLGMKILSGPHIEYVDVSGNKGLTGVCIIETSHIAMHVWDEVSPGLMQFDVYTCGKMDLQVIKDALLDFDPVKIEYKYLDREHGLNELGEGTL